jgi:hypothetical protein
MIFYVDIDGTIAKTEHGDYNHSKPDEEMISLINRLYDKGHTVIYYTARGTTTGIDWHTFTNSQLVGWGVKFHELLMGKPDYNFWIDDRAINPHFMKDVLKKIINGV